MKESNYVIGRRLEEPVYETYHKILSEKFSPAETVNNPSSGVEAIIYAPSGEHPIYEVKWYKPNQGTKTPDGQSRPDFELRVNGELIQTIECKNLNPNFYLYQTWADERIFSRYTQPSQVRILIISHYTIYPGHEEIINTAIQNLNLNVVQLGKQVTEDDKSLVYGMLYSNPTFMQPFNN